MIRRHGIAGFGAPTTALVMVGIVLSMLVASVVPATAAPADEDLVILELRLGRTVLSQGILAYWTPDAVLLPLGSMADLLEFAVAVDPERGVASGWFQDESRRFSLDLTARRAESEGAASDVPVGLAVSADDDIYVDGALFSAWFPVDVEVRTSQLLVVLTGREDLPVERRLRREQARDERLERQRNLISFPVEKAEYGSFTWPLLDLTAEYRGRGEDRTARAAVQGSADMATLGTSFFVSHEGNGEAVDIARITAGRTDPDGELLGPLQATLFEFGDLYAPSTPLVLRGKLGRGVQVGNRALRRPDRYDVTEIEGDGSPGWEVELYANGALLDFSVVDENGRYLFEDVPLLFGRNEFKAVLYGPQGQTREQVRLINVGGEMIPAGSVTWRLFTVQDDRFLITGDETLLDTPDRGMWTTHMEVGTGITRFLSVIGSLTRQPLNGMTHSYRSLTAQTVWSGFHFQGTYSDDADGGAAINVAGQGQLLGRSLTFDHALFSDFVSDANDPTQQRTSETRIRIGGNGRWRGRPLSYDLKLETESFTGRSITRQDVAEMRAAAPFDRIQVSGKLGLRHSTSGDDGYTRMYTDQLASGYWGPVLLRGSLRTRFTPGTALEAATLSAAWRPLPRLRIGARLQRHFSGGGATTTGGSLSLLRDSYQVSLNTHATDGQPTFVSLALTTSFTKVPDRTRFHVQRQRMSNGFGATARVFLDRNGNGMFDDRDDPLPQVRLAGGGDGRDIYTDDYGQAYIGGLPAHRERDITLDLDSLEDPYLLPVVPGRSAVGHAGGHVTLDFPVTYSGDIEGTLYVQTPTGRLPLRGLQLELVDMQQKVLRTSISEFDGYYLFQEVPPGWYEVRIREESLSRRRLRKPAPVAVAVPVDGGVSDGNDFILHFVNERQAGR